MNIVLTGATGFIGRHVAAALQRAGHQLTPLTRPGYDLLQPDCPLPPGPFDLGIHLAWYVEPGKYLDSPLNDEWVRASLRLAQMVRCRRWLVAGTCFEYAMTNRPLAETDPATPTTRYARAKLELLRQWQALPSELVWVRIFYQYGPFEDPRRLVPHIITSLLRGQHAELTAGTQVRDFLHVEDVGSAIATVATSTLTGIVNIGSGTGMTVRQIAETIGELTGRPDLLAFGAKPMPPHDPPFVVADTTRLRSLGWHPRYDLCTGLAQTIAWWRQRL